MMDLAEVQFRSHVSFGIGRSGKGDVAAAVGKQLGRGKVKSMTYDEKRGFVVLTPQADGLPVVLVPIQNVSCMVPVPSTAPRKAAPVRTVDGAPVTPKG